MKAKLLLLMLFAWAFMSCEKEATTPDCPAEAQLCVQIGTERVSGSAVWYRIPGQNRFRVLWEEGTGTAYRNIEIDLYTTDSVLMAGSYPTNDSRTAGTSAVQFYTNSFGWYGVGTFSVSSVNNNAITGTFSGTLTKDGSTETMEYSSGQLQAVPRQ